MSSLDQLTKIFRPAIETELKEQVARGNKPGLNKLYQMMAYHMGWEGEDAGAKAEGKRIRPLLTLLTTAAAGGNWQEALPAAAAIELIHNFSLIHDDIEDNSPLRRGRPTLWTKWGIPQAINTGDAMFTLAHLAMLDLGEMKSPEITVQAAQILQATCLHLTQGQYLDISYENRNDLTISDYWPMVGGKTAALLAACTEIGALIAEVDQQTRAAYRSLGHDLGLAFQALDDLLGIWGDSAKIGKSNASDLVSGKKSLPVLYGLAQKGSFAERWLAGPVSAGEVTTVAAQLEKEGARTYTQHEADRLTQKAINALEEADPQGEAGTALLELANMLLKRDV